MKILQAILGVSLCAATLCTAQTINTELHRVRIATLTQGLAHPWGMAFLPDGRMLVTERTGRLRVIGKDFKLEPQPVGGVPTVYVQVEADLPLVGLLGPSRRLQVRAHAVDESP